MSIVIPELFASKTVKLVGAANAALARYDVTLKSIEDLSIYRKILGLHETISFLNLMNSNVSLDSYVKYTAHLIPESVRKSIPDECTIDIYAEFNYKKNRELHQEIISEKNDTLILAAIQYADIFVNNKPDVRNRGFYLLVSVYIPNYLCSHNVISCQMFYLSEYLLRHKEEYLQFVNGFQGEKDLTHWIEFLLQAMKSQADINNLKLIDMHNRFKLIMDKIGSKKNAAVFIKYCYQNPVFYTSRGQQ
jgi:hypothetical protein